MSPLSIRQFLFFAVFLHLLYSQYLTEIQIFGNIHTRRHIILQELEHPIPAQYNAETAEQDKNRLYNLGIFSKVSIVPENSTYTIYITETPHFIPIPLIYYDEEKGKKGWTYGAGFININFHGANEKLIAGITMGNLDNWFLNFENPKYGVKQRFLKLEMQDISQEDAVYAAQKRTVSIKGGTGFQVNNRQFYQLLMEYSQYNYSVNTDTSRWFFPVELPKKSKYLCGHFNYIYDSRNIKNDPTQGRFFSFTMATHKNLDGNLDLIRINIENRMSWLISQRFKNPVIHLSHQLLYGFADTFPLHQKKYLGGGDFIRGYSSIPFENTDSVIDRIEVDHLFVQSLELQFELLPKIVRGNLEFGLDQAFFIDCGLGWQDGNSRRGKGLIGYGWGLRLFISGYGVLAVDLGFNPYESNAVLNVRSVN